MTLTPTHLRVCDLPQPIGTCGVPYFGWHLTSAVPDQIQTHYQIRVASSPASLAAGQANLWDSGMVASGQQNHIPYGGRPLRANQQCFWNVRVWDGAQRPGPDSAIETFVVGLLTNADWAGASWVRRTTEDLDGYTYYRKSFALSEHALARAILFVSAVHKYELYLNGQPVGAGPSYHYPQYQYYNAYAVTALLRPGGPNVLALLTHWFGPGQGRPASASGLLLKLVIEFAEGPALVIGTDATWKQTRAASWLPDQPPRNDEGVGYVEQIDAARLIPDWFAPGYDDSAWGLVSVIGPPPVTPWTGALLPDLSRIVEHVVRPVAVTQPRPDCYVVDLGQVWAGRPRIHFSGGKAGEVVAMRGGYTLAPDGTIDLATTQNTDMTYVAVTSGGAFVFQPQEYLGLRFFQIERPPMSVTAQSFEFVARHAALDAGQSAFTTSDEGLNRVWHLLKRSLYLGAQEQFLDTPTREKGGFLVDSANESLAAMGAFGERVLTLKTLSEFLHSMDHYWSSPADRGRINAVYPNGDGARDIPDFTQAYLTWVWAYYWQTGNRQFLREHYARLASVADYVARHLNPRTGLVHRLTGGGGPYQFGIVDWPPSMRYGYDMATDARTVVNALGYADFDIVARIAAVLEDTTGAARYRALADQLKAAINARLVNMQGLYVDGLMADGTPSAHVSQHGNMLPLALGLVPPERLASVLQHVKRLRVSVGMVTIGWLIQALGEAGEGEHLLEVYTRPDWDNWAADLARGATCTWESWDADTGKGLSQSHPWGAVGLCGLQAYVLGVTPLAPQCEWVQIKPLWFGARLTHAQGRVPTERGPIDVSWQRRDDTLTLTLTLPPNVQARVCLPGEAGDDTRVWVDGAPMACARDGQYLIVEHVGSGTHTFERCRAA